MRLYRVTTHAPLFPGVTGRNIVNRKCFSNKSSAKKYAVSEKRICEDYDSYYIECEELELHDLDKSTLIKAFNNEDIIDLVASANPVVIYELKLETAH